jgi:hypothetical protein
MSRLALRIAALLTVGFVLPAQGVILSGGMRTAVYLQKSRLGASSFAAGADSLDMRARLLETVRLDAAQLGRPGLSLHTAFTGINVLTDQSARQTRFRLFRGYLQGAGKVQDIRYDARLGRQWVLAGVGSGVVDGLSLGLNMPQWGSLDGFFGTLGSDHLYSTSRFWDLEKPSESRSYGGRLRLHHSFGEIVPSLALSLAEVDRNHHSRLHTTTGADSVPHSAMITDAQRLGVHGEVLAPLPLSLPNGLLRNVRVYGDYRQDMVWGRTLNAGGGAELSGGPRAARLFYDYERRRPALAVSSFFASFDTRAVQQHRLGLGTRVYRDLRCDLGGDLFLYDGGNKESGVSLQVSGYGASVGYRVHNGYGGALSGLILYGHRDLTEKIFCDASLDFTQYKYGAVPSQSVSGIDDNEKTGLLALNYRLLPRLVLTGQVEAMENQDFKHDVRFLGVVQWDFRRAF